VRVEFLASIDAHRTSDGIVAPVEYVLVRGRKP